MGQTTSFDDESNAANPPRDGAARSGRNSPWRVWLVLLVTGALLMWLESASLLRDCERVRSEWLRGPVNTGLQWLSASRMGHWATEVTAASDTLLSAAQERVVTPSEQWLVAILSGQEEPGRGSVAMSTMQVSVETDEALHDNLESPPASLDSGSESQPLRVAAAEKEAPAPGPAQPEPLSAPSAVAASSLATSPEWSPPDFIVSDLDLMLSEEAAAMLQSLAASGAELWPELLGPAICKATAAPAIAVAAATKERARLTGPVLLVGDSLMQGVAPSLERKLKKEFSLQVINKGKQNTGLTYLKYYNWPERVKGLISEIHPSVIIVMLGANDPWDMLVNGKFVKFGGPQWQEEYARRVRDIMQASKDQGIDLYWIGMPAMRREQLDEGSNICDEIYQSETEKAGVSFVPTRDALSGSDGGYTQYIRTSKGRRVLLRADDGVHFSVKGADIIADLVIAKMHNQLTLGR
jgi:lysophospholipase L1-like esterase